MSPPPRRLEILRLDGQLPIPRYAREGDAGLDLYARHTVTVPAGGWAAVSTGIALAIPVGNAGLIVPRSGLALDKGVTVLNAPGVIDSGFRGELKVLLVNHGSTGHQVNRGDRVAQLVITQLLTLEIVEVEALEPTERGSSGFGDSGP